MTPSGLKPRPRDDVLRRMRSAAGRKDDPASAVLAARTIRRSELFRVAVADLTGALTLDDLGAAMTDLTAALLEVTLEVCVRDLEERTGAPALTRVLVVGMGRLGGGEQGYGSDADVVFVHDPVEGADEAEAPDPGARGGQGADPAARAARPRPEPRRRRLAAPGGQERPARAVAGVVPRSTTRAGPSSGRRRPCCGRPRWPATRGWPSATWRSIAPIRWPQGGLDAGQVREIRTLKARMEAERLPRGADRKTHFKLGHGGLSDVEWVVQLVQLRHAHDHPELRTTSTMGALAAAERLGLVAPGHAADLAAAWRLASSMRNAGVLFRGKALDSVPSDPRDADGIARILGLPGGSGQELGERYRRVARRARAAHEAELYDA